MAIINLTALNRSEVPINIGAYNLLPNESITLDLDTSSNVEIWGDIRNSQMNNKIVLTINSVSDSNTGGGQVNLSTVVSSFNVTVVNSGGSSAILPPATGTAAGVLSAADKSKLDNISPGATANSTDAQLRDRSTHTGTQAISTINGLQSAIDAKQDTLISGTNVKTINGNSIVGPGTIVINTDLGTTTDANQIVITSSSGNNATLNGASTTIAGLMVAADKVKLNGVAVGATANSTDAQLRDRSTHTGYQSIDTISNLQTALNNKQDTLVSGSSIKTINGQTILGAGDINVASNLVTSRIISSASESTQAGDQILSNNSGINISLTIQQNHIQNLEVQQLKTGTITLVAGSGVTLIGPTLATSGIFQQLVVKKTGSPDTYLVQRVGGDLIWNNP